MAEPAQVVTGAVAAATIAADDGDRDGTGDPVDQLTQRVTGHGPLGGAAFRAGRGGRHGARCWTYQWRRSCAR